MNTPADTRGKLASRSRSCLELIGLSSSIFMPRYGRITRPCLVSCSTTALTASMGMANDTPSADIAFMLLMPTTAPSRSTRGPPELPCVSP